MTSYSMDLLIRDLHNGGISGDFDPEILRNRLTCLGVKQILEEKSIHEFGFPCKYHSPLDEAILMLHYFLAKGDSLKRSQIKIRTIHVPTKEEENNLSFWKSAKAGLYLDLHSMILLNNRERKKKKNEIKRLFVFRDNAQLAHLESVGIAVILEQKSIGIDTGFVFSKDQDKKKVKLLKGMLLIELLHPEKDKCEWAVLVDLADQSSTPYKSGMVCKWFKGRLEDDKSDRYNLNSKEFRDLFRFENKLISEKTGSLSYTFEAEPERIKELLEANFKYAVSTIPGSLALIDKYKETVSMHRVPEKLAEFNTTISLIKKSRKIHAIDATSVKITLKVHETDANYRHWIRTTLTTVLENPDAYLERIYIIETPNGTKNDYDVLGEELNLYYDYLKKEIQTLKEVWDVSDSRVIKELQANVRIFVITKTAVEQFCEDPRLEEFYEDPSIPESKQGHLLKLVSQVVERQKDDPLQLMMPRLDFLYAEYLIYNYKDYRGEPSQPEYTADLSTGPKMSDLGYPTQIDYEEKRKAFEENRDDFEKKREVFAELFNTVKDLSVPVLLIEESGLGNTVTSGQLPKLEQLELQLEEKREAYFASLAQQVSADRIPKEGIVKTRNWLYVIGKFVSTALGPLGAPIEAGLELGKTQEADRINSQIQGMIQKTQELQTETLRVLLEHKLDYREIETVAGVINDVTKYGQGDLDESYKLLTESLKLSDGEKKTLIFELAARFSTLAEVQNFHAFLNGTQFPMYLLEPEQAPAPYFSRFADIFSGIPLLIQQKVVDRTQTTLMFSPTVFKKYNHHVS